jgi:2-iminobutanoate/2-iminopropanoate deaminase
MKRITDGPIEKPVGPYSPAVEAGGWLFISSQMGTEDGTMHNGVREQTIQALRNIEKVLHAASAGRRDLVKVMVFLRNIADYAEMNAAYSEFFGRDFPARSTIGGLELARGALVEIEATACLSQDE